MITLAYGLPPVKRSSEVESRSLWVGVACQAWHKLQPDPSAALSQIATPPCKVPSAFPANLSGGWSVDPGCDASLQPDTCSYHPGAYSCYRHAYAATGPGTQACYDVNGQFISDPWQGAGTLDLETPIGDIIQQGKHALVDVFPYYYCCSTLFKQPDTCNLYYAKRPPGQCSGELLSSLNKIKFR